MRAAAGRIVQGTKKVRFDFFPAVHKGGIENAFHQAVVNGKVNGFRHGTVFFQIKGNAGKEPADFPAVAGSGGILAGMEFSGLCRKPDGCSSAYRKRQEAVPV